MSQLNVLEIFHGGNGDWYVATAPEGQGTAGRGVRGPMIRLPRRAPWKWRPDCTFAQLRPDDELQTCHVYRRVPARLARLARQRAGRWLLDGEYTCSWPRVVQVP